MRSSTQSTNLSDTQWNECKTLLDSNTYYIVHRNGPTVMNVRGETDDVYRVMIGNPHSCSCKKSPGFCVHILFVVLKVLRIPENHPIAKKNSLTDSEIDFVLSGNFGGREKRTIIRKEKKTKEISKFTSSSPEDTDTVERQPMDDENPDICPICQDDMTKDDPLTWCRKGCGNNIHAKCMKLYAQYKTTNSTNILCPLCREDWGPNAIQILNDDCKGRSSLKKACATSQCHACTFQIRGDLFRCIECSFKSYQQLLSQATATGASNSGVTPPAGAAVSISSSKRFQTKTQPIDFCARCFQNVTREHARHHFITSTATELLTEFEWKHIKNPRAPQQLIDENILSTLQQRDLTDEDYDLLLGLDRKSDGIPLQKVLLDSLTSSSSAPSSSPLCWCKNTSLDSLKSYLLPCGHQVHEQCLSSLLDDAVSEGSWKLDDISCGFLHCKVPIFRGISRRRFKLKKEETKSEEAATATAAAAAGAGGATKGTGLGSNSLLCGISGISIHGSSPSSSHPHPHSAPSCAPLSTSTRLTSQKIVRSTSSRNFHQRQLEINQRQEDFANGQLGLGSSLAANPLHIGGGGGGGGETNGGMSSQPFDQQQQQQAQQQGQGQGQGNRSRVPHKIRPPRNPTGTRRLAGLLSTNRMRSMTDEEFCDDEDLTSSSSLSSSSVLMNGIVPRAIDTSVDRSAATQHQRPTAIEQTSERQRNRIPIRKRSNGFGVSNLMTTGMSSQQDSNQDTSSLSLGGVGLVPSTESTAQHPPPAAHHHAAPPAHANAAAVSRPLPGKRIKSSPAGLLAASARGKTDIETKAIAGESHLQFELGLQRTSS